MASLFPQKFFPIPLKGFDQTIKYLFGYEKKNFLKVGYKYLMECQPFMKETWNFLVQYPIEDLCLPKWNKLYNDNPELNISIKNELSEEDKVWLVQDFHLFVHRQILDLHKPKNKKLKIAEDIELSIIEGKSVLAQHIRGV